jgi:hypothetical protein
MNDDEAPVPSDDAVAAAMRAALTRTVEQHASLATEWTRVMALAKRTKVVRRFVVAGAAVLVILGASAIAFAATGNGRRNIAVVGPAASTTTSTPTTSSTAASSPTTTASVPTTAPGGSCGSCPASTAPPRTSPSTSTAPVPPARPAQAGDFSGVLTHWRIECDPCVRDGLDKGITLLVRNATDHRIDLSTAAPVRVAVVCSTNMTADGKLTQPLPSFPTDIFADYSVTPGGLQGTQLYASPGTSLAPGQQATNSGATGFTFEGLDPGTATCEGAIVASSDGSWNPATLSVVAKLANVPTYSFQLVDAPSSTTSSTTSTAP